MLALWSWTSYKAFQFPSFLIYKVEIMIIIVPITEGHCEIKWISELVYCLEFNKPSLSVFTMVFISLVIGNLILSQSHYSECGPWVMPQMWKWWELRTNIPRLPYIPRGFFFFFNSLTYTQLFHFFGWMHKNASFNILISWWIFLGWDCRNLYKFYISLVIRKRKECKNKTRKKKMRVMEKGYNHGDSHPTMEFPSVFQESYKSRKWACFHHWWNNIGRGFWLACIVFHICLILCSTIAFWQLTEWGSSCSIIGCGVYGWRDPHCSLPQLNQIWSLSSFLSAAFEYESVYIEGDIQEGDQDGETSLLLPFS